MKYILNILLFFLACNTGITFADLFSRPFFGYNKGVNKFIKEDPQMQLSDQYPLSADTRRDHNCLYKSSIINKVNKDIQDNTQNWNTTFYQATRSYDIWNWTARLFWGATLIAGTAGIGTLLYKSHYTNLNEDQEKLLLAGAAVTSAGIATACSGKATKTITKFWSDLTLATDKDIIDNYQGDSLDSFTAIFDIKKGYYSLGFHRSLKNIWGIDIYGLGIQRAMQAKKNIEEKPETNNLPIDTFNTFIKREKKRHFIDKFIKNSPYL